MITLISNSRIGVCEWCVSNVEEMNSLDTNTMLPSSTCSIIDDTGLRVFTLKADKTGWVEL